MSEVNCNPHLYAIIAGEVSGDTLGAGLMKAILRHDPEAKFIGIGGQKMIQCGMVSAFNMEELSVMGIFEVAAHAIPILKIRSAITKLLLKERPCIMIGIDSPDFNLSVEHALKKAGIKTVHYVSPSVWAWREKRIVKIKASCDEILALLPFEKEFYDRHDMPCTYVGHTLANSIPVKIDQSLARERSGLYKNCVDGVPGKVLAILPGSRRGIIKRMLPIYALSAALLHEKIKDLSFISVAPNRDIALLIKDIWLEYCPQLSLTVFVGDSQDVIASADACLLTCGTIAFEAMLLKCPMVVAYKVSRLSAAIARRLLKVNMYSLPNLLAKREIVKELIQEDCTPIKLAHECIRLLTSDNLLMKKEFTTIHESIKTNTDELAARAVMRLVAQEQQQLSLGLKDELGKLTAEEQALDKLSLVNYAKKPKELALQNEDQAKSNQAAAAQDQAATADPAASAGADSAEAAAASAADAVTAVSSADTADALVGSNTDLNDGVDTNSNQSASGKSKRAKRKSKSKSKSKADSNAKETEATANSTTLAASDLSSNDVNPSSLSISLEVAQNAAGYRNFLDKTKSASAAASASAGPNASVTSSANDSSSASQELGLPSVNDAEVPLKNGLDDKTVKKLEKEAKEEAGLSLSEVLSMPNKSARSKNRDIVKRVTQRI
ncbi:lipid-A-disaccharide synthase [Anaerobiospirillum sp. NML120448]|uniref:lipid-A-disaccharide synthase n=1 Tax=Anaerobiospirillum sp. NML120448 TaxID=2932816 RepID=UPI001FF67963|nr:lipid-A-disaccharide synthase [Anaerobiospirillum sp. NML120448]MCK0513460.1 lipid-A-disaccharide synthase [Anaerobiospirillum sp. NML120448]